MDEYIKQSISSRKDAIFNAYELGATEKEKVETLFSDIEKLGRKCKDVGEFEAKFMGSPLNQKYLDLFTEIATTSSPKSNNATADIKKAKKQIIGNAVGEGIATGALDNALQQAKTAVLPTRASINQEAYNAASKVPVLGNAIDISQKAGYAMHLGKLFGKRKKDKKDKGTS